MLQLYIFVSFGALFGIAIIILQSMLLQICSAVNLSFDFLLLCFLFMFQSYHAPKTGLWFFCWLFLGFFGFFCGGKYFCCFVSLWLFCLFVGGWWFFCFLRMNQTDIKLIFMMPYDCENLIPSVLLDGTTSWTLELTVQLSRNTS